MSLQNPNSGMFITIVILNIIVLGTLFFDFIFQVSDHRIMEESIKQLAATNTGTNNAISKILDGLARHENYSSKMFSLLEDSKCTECHQTHKKLVNPITTKGKPILIPPDRIHLQDFYINLEKYEDHIAKQKKQLLKKQPTTK
jgi:hypothetical protein